jgi:Tfp pilus assembly protein PilV
MFTMEYARNAINRRTTRDFDARRKLEAGELLIEVLVTVSIISIGVVGIMSSLGSSVRLSSVSRAAAQADQLLVRYAENLAAQPYEPCTDGSAYEKASAVSIPASDLPAGISVGAYGTAPVSDFAFEMTIESVSYWNGDTSPATFTTTCPKQDAGTQQLTLAVRTGDQTVSRRLTIVKRVA